MGISLNKLIENKDAVIELATQYGIDELKYAPIVFPSEAELGVVNLLATKRQPVKQKDLLIIDFQHALKERFEIDANVFTPEGIQESIARESLHTPDTNLMQTKYQPIITNAFPLIDITPQNSAVTVIETKSHYVSELVTKYREHKRLRTTEPSANKGPTVYQSQQVEITSQISALLLALPEEQRIPSLLIILSRVDCPISKLQSFVSPTQQATTTTGINIGKS